MTTLQALIEEDAEQLRSLRVFAETFDDFQQMRIAAANRMRLHLLGGGNTKDYEITLKELSEMETAIGKKMRVAYRSVSGDLLEWQQGTPGIGEHLLARLIGVLGHPVIATPTHWTGKGPTRKLTHDEPFVRSVSQLWAYCGHGDPARKRRKGMTAEETLQLGNPKAKMLLHLISEGCIKTRNSPYRAVYDDARATYASRLHAVPCVRCGPAGSPAQPGSPWNLGHQHAAALRKVGKEILRDMWSICESEVQERLGAGTMAVHA